MCANETTILDDSLSLAMEGNVQGGASVTVSLWLLLGCGMAISRAACCAVFSFATGAAGNIYGSLLDPDPPEQIIAIK